MGNHMRKSNDPPHTRDRKSVLLRLDTGTVDRIDDICRRRQPVINRSDWLRQAIAEKLEREEAS